MENKLDFVIIGGMKCGSTAMGTYLSLHPDVNFCNMIETNYFSANSINIKSLEEYFKFYFQDRLGLKGESSPTYSYPETLRTTALKLKGNFPDVKIILIVRNPLNRVVSHINHLILNGVKIPVDIDHYLEEKIDIIDKSRFGYIVDEYIKVFGKDSFHIVKFEDVVAGSGLEEVCEFLGLKPQSKSLPPINKTDNRYIDLSIIRFYKKNWTKIPDVPGFKKVKKPIRKFIDKTFSKKLLVENAISLSPSTKDKIIERLHDDTLLFKKHYHFSPFDLSK